jgi:thiaminase (transcriptional activator TenA)
MPLSHTLWTLNADWAGKILAHPFVRGLGDGSLPVEAFKRYVAQDAYFLEAFARAYAFCLAHSMSRDDLHAFAELIAGVLEELKLHSAYAERWHVDLAHVAPGEATRAYVDFLLQAARAGNLGETIAAMTPCMRLYAFLGQTLARAGIAPLYAEWAKTYADPGFETLAARLEALLDTHAVDSATVRANYRRAMELEHGFFAASLS